MRGQELGEFRVHPVRSRSDRMFLGTCSRRHRRGCGCRRRRDGMLGLGKISHGPPEALIPSRLTVRPTAGLCRGLVALRFRLLSSFQQALPKGLRRLARGLA